MGRGKRVDQRYRRLICASFHQCHTGTADHFVLGLAEHEIATLCHLEGVE